MKRKLTKIPVIFSIFLILLLASCPAEKPESGIMTVTIINADEQNGNTAIVAVYPEGVEPGPTGFTGIAIITITDGTGTGTISDSNTMDEIELDPGTYTVFAYFDLDDSGDVTAFDMFAQAEAEVDGDVTVTFDYIEEFV
jgi:hypothetical protein